MTIEEAKKFKEYKFFLNGVENLIDDLRKNWMENMEEDGERYIGVAVLEFGYIDIELNILTEEQVSRIPCSGNKTPVIDYFVCIKNIEWESDGYADWNVNVNWNSDNWVSQLERDMFAALEKYKDEHGYRYNRPNYGVMEEDRKLLEIDGIVKDADTILVDMVQENDFEITGIAQDIFNIWRNSSDKKAVEQMFFEFTDMEFKDFLEKCKDEITR